ncbi:predicted protein [Chaetomium globosum CBS 148.51]|uniref:Uncharacterized protein n=1 Tax=Chaetomium globosum (strain ATCC 6205 / CBS 148.51 / DSM 1962 / NBRC 6347 / NRRL 1970) TaxID=306901 RepID=Q2GQ94_CHAGB|nr:uncharacterized protein CHGG_09860 [Chaetomium globosum CBS 148.51]EAQ83456.1 predicted protein [Chaetomium globosum CBS 148.51]
MARRTRPGAKKHTSRSKKTYITGKKGKRQPDQNSRFPKFSHFPAEIQWKIFREVLNGDPHFHVLRVGRVDDAHAGTWKLSFSPVTRKEDNSGYRMYDELSSVNPAAAAAVRHELALRRRGQFEGLPFKILDARIDGAKDLIVFDFARSTVPAMGDSLAEQFQNTEKFGIKLSPKHYSCHDMDGNFRCVDRAFPNYASSMPSSIPYHGNKKHDLMDLYLKGYFAGTYPTEHPTNKTPFYGISTLYIPLHHSDALPAFGFPNNPNTNHHHHHHHPPPHHPTTSPGPFPALQDLHDMHDMLAAVADHFFLDRLPPQHSRYVGPSEYRLERAAREKLVFGVLVAVGREKKSPGPDIETSNPT